MTTESKRRVLVGEHLTLDDVAAVADGRATVVLGAGSRERLAKARAAVEALLVDDAPATYGINTGFGALAERRIAAADLARLQHNLIRSHCVGVGRPLPRRQTRALMLLRANVLALGYSGVRICVVEHLLAMLERGVHPVVPSRGSVGASGDLAPLAHLALGAIGEGESELDGELMPAGDALAAVGLAPLELAAKEGLALINGTQGMLAVGGLALEHALRLAATADVTGAMTLEALKGSVRPFDEAIVLARPHPGAVAAAAHLRELLDQSEIVTSHAHCTEVQDAYSLRCMPQVHGSARDLLAFATQVIGIELDSATDNPLVLPGGTVQSGGNFHGQPVAAALDTAALGVVDLASIAERRLAQLMDPALNRGLPPFLALDSGLNSGFMMAQVTAAALVSEARVLATPKSTDSISTSADREDHVSMGMTAAHHFARIVEHLEHVLSIEAVVAAEGIRQRGLAPGAGVARAVALLADVVPPLLVDRVLYRDFEAARVLIRSGALLLAADADPEGAML